MKKAFILALLCLISLCLPFVLTGCGDGETSKTPSNDVSGDQSAEESIPEPTEPIVVENGLSIKKKNDSPLKIAQFADLHFGVEGNAYHNNKTERTKEYMRYIVETEKPDLIVCTGDTVMTTGVEKLGEFVELMDSLKTPWIFMYGNHDAESSAEGYCKKDLSAYLESCSSEYLIYNEGYVETENNRYGNFSVSILNEKGTKLLGAIIIFDSGVYNGAISSYDSITKGQIEWYKGEIDKLGELYIGEGVMPSVVFSHIQLPEYYDAYKKALSGNGAEFIIKQPFSSSDIEGIKGGGPTYENTGLFDVMKEKKSTVAFFCGHDHIANFQVKMDGIILGFGPQTGFSTLFKDNDMPRQSYIYSFDDKLAFTTKACIEDGSTLGLTYSGTFDSSGILDEATGKYTVSYNFNFGNTIELAFNGVRLTKENTTITGSFKNITSPEWKAGFYSPNGKTFVFDGLTTRSCTFTYDPKTKTLDISMKDVEVDPNAPTSIKFKTHNSDAGADAIGLWTTAGTKIKTVTDASTGAGNWIGNGWRYYVVCDSEGRIAYAVQFPISGYGGPDGSSYYTHFVYSSDYKTNPAITTLDGFANDWAAGGIGYTLFEIQIPEGGFAFTGHGSAIFEMVDMLSQGVVENYDLGNINTRSIYNNNIRVSYDLEEKTISITTVED